MENLRSLVARVLDIIPEEIDDESSPKSIPSWDSFNGIMLVSELEKRFDVKFTLQEIESVKSFREIKEALKRQGILDGLDD